MELDLTDVIKVVIAVVIAGLAGSQIADTWLNGSLFARPVKWLRGGRDESLVAELLTCGFCLRHWTTLVCLGVMMYWAGQCEESWRYVAMYPVCWFAAVRVSLLFEREVEEVIDQTDEVEEAMD